MTRGTALFIAMLGFTAVSCGGGAEPPPQKSEAAPEDVAATAKAEGIDWFDGTVDKAFAFAKAEGRPVYLYWSAEWCPPCHAIKATVFRSPEFIERSKLFVPVYLDGDTANAQAAGERFGVLGYPTMIVFSPDGKELTRIPGGIDMAAYASVLDLALSNSSSTRDLVDRLLADGGALSVDECEQLAFYSWGQDPQMFAERDAVDAFRRMYTSCPSESVRERAILYTAWLEHKIQAADPDEEGTPAFTADEKREALAQLRTILADETLSRDNVFPLIWSGAAITAALTEPKTQARESLTAAFDAAYDRLFADESLYKRERIYTLRGRLRFERIDDPEAEPSDALRDRILEIVAWADESTPSADERQPIVNAAANVLVEAGLDDRARELLVAELEISKQPYYYMPDIAAIEQRAGNDELALSWLKKAWDESVGPATRFQWGYYYLSGLIEMAPGNDAAIRQTTLTLIEELQAAGGFFQRPKAQLARLETALEAWGEEHAGGDTLAALRADVSALCAEDAAEASRRVCEQFLDPA